MFFGIWCYIYGCHATLSCTVTCSNKIGKMMAIKWIRERMVYQGRRHIVYARVNRLSDLFNLNIYWKSRHVVIKLIAIQHRYVYINYSSYVLSLLSPELPFLFVITTTAFSSAFVIILNDCYQVERILLDPTHLTQSCAY